MSRYISAMSLEAIDKVSKRLPGIGLWARYQNTNLKQKEAILGILLIIPSVGLISLLILFPFLYNAYISFHTVPLAPGQPLEWVGLDNYRWLFSNSQFWSSAWTSVLFTVFSSVTATVAGLVVALLLQYEFRGRRLVRGLSLLPYVTPVIATAFVWRWMFQPVYGSIPYILRSIGLEQIGRMDFLSEPTTGLFVVILYDTWRYFPFAFLFLIARIQAIPDEMYEAAKIDGASRFAIFKDITLPELKYVLATIILLRGIWNFNSFTDVWLVTHQVEVLPILTYLTAFNAFEMGRAAALAMVLFVFLITLSSVYVSRFIDW